MMEVENQPTQIIQDVEMKGCELTVEEQLKQAEEERLNPSTPSSSARLSQIVADYKKIQESSASEIEKKRTAVRSKCQERLWMAGVLRDYQLDIIKRSFEAEVKQIEREHQNEFNSLKDALMHDLQEEKKRLQALEQANASNLSIDRAGNLIESQPTELSVALTAEEQASGRRLRRRDEKASELAALTASMPTANTAANTSSSRRKQANNIYTFNTLLQEQDILDDLGAIAKEAGSLAPTRRSGTKSNNPSAMISNTSSNTEKSTNGTSVSVEKGALHYNWDIISVGERIRIQLSPNSSATTATLISANTTEISILTSSGRTVKVAVADLKLGKVAILVAGHDYEE